MKLYQTKNAIKNISALSESCVHCHGDVKGFSEFHNPQKIGCSSCHLGNVKEKDKNLAHAGMIKIPGNLENAKQTCGKVNCHPGISERVDSSLMSTMSGIISVNKFAFDEIKNLNGKYHIEKIKNSAAESHLRNLCASCHLGNEKTEFGPITELSRGGGCNTCHLNYSDEAKNELHIYNLFKIEKPDLALIKYHPSLSLNITNNHCFGCHSRSGRISTNYEGWHETSFTDKKIVDDKNFRLLEDGRIFQKEISDIHFEAGLVCVDCHISYEIMGNGKFYEHKEEQILVKCEDCHSEKFTSIKLSEFDFESKKIAEIFGIDDENRKFIKVKKSQTPLVNTKIINNRIAKLYGKQSKKIYDLNPAKFECVNSKAHKSLSCNSCHTSWAPQCVGCHTEFDPKTKGFDLLKNNDTDSSWVEFNGEFFAELPTLGIKEFYESGKIKKSVETFIPGMIMTLDKSKYSKKNEEITFKRLFAPSVAHTIGKESRSCESCHNNSLAIGYGRGNLKYIIHNKIGKWIFKSKYKNVEYDNLPEDAWIGFLQTRNKDFATRKNIRPFNIDEQKRILTVGACLTCHKSDSEIMKESLSNIENQLKNLSQKCILPNW
ncbi:MAG: hypothetical protein IPM32_01230 [Ignavibacteriae bacterium]|nr:hypothetical protein [Ignavibacteriota bacterium]